MAQTFSCVRFVWNAVLRYRTGAFYQHQEKIGSIMSGLNMGMIKELPVRLPDIVEQKRVVSSIQELHRETQSLELIYQQKLTALTELKQSLLQKAFAGELTVESEPQPVEVPT